MINLLPLEIIAYLCQFLFSSEIKSLIVVFKRKRPLINLLLREYVRVFDDELISISNFIDWSNKADYQSKILGKGIRIVEAIEMCPKLRPRLFNLIAHKCLLAMKSDKFGHNDYPDFIDLIDEEYFLIIESRSKRKLKDIYSFPKDRLNLLNQNERNILRKFEIIN